MIEGEVGSIFERMIPTSRRAVIRDGSFCCIQIAMVVTLIVWVTRAAVLVSLALV
jgi:hypothetical protein